MTAHRAGRAVTAALMPLRLGPVAADILRQDGDAEVAAVFERSCYVAAPRGFVCISLVCILQVQTQTMGMQTMYESTILRRRELTQPSFIANVALWMLPLLNHVPAHQASADGNALVRFFRAAYD